MYILFSLVHKKNHGGPMSEIRLYFFFIFVFVSVICHLGKPQYFRQQSHHHWRTSRTQLDRIPRRTLGKYQRYWIVFIRVLPLESIKDIGLYLYEFYQLFM